MADLYVILSRTTTGMGKLIRTFTRSHYNHVSLTLHQDLSGIVSFARVCIDTPLRGGYVTEPVERFLYTGEPVPVRIFRLEISEEKSQQLQQLFALAGHHDKGLLYNHFAAFTTLLHLPCPVCGAYTCLSFASAVLGKSYRTLQELEQELEPFEVFHGDLRQRCQDSGDRTNLYFTRRGFLQGTKDTAAHSLNLLDRVLRPRSFDDPLAKI